MPETCKFITTIERECGRPATHSAQWQHAGSTVTLQLPVCPFHRDLTEADLVTDCTVADYTIHRTEALTPAAPGATS